MRMTIRSGHDRFGVDPTTDVLWDGWRVIVDAEELE
jgi:hypothetical protein